MTRIVDASDIHVSHAVWKSKRPAGESRILVWEGGEKPIVKHTTLFLFNSLIIPESKKEVKQ